MAYKGRLYKLKNWLTLADSAAYLSSVFEEEITEADILQLGLEGQLKLSIDLVNHAVAKEGKVSSFVDAEMYVHKSGRLPSEKFSYYHDEGGCEEEELDDLEKEARKVSGSFTERNKGNVSQDLILAIEAGSYELSPVGKPLTGDKYVKFSDEVTPISGIWDLPLIGSEAIDVMHYLQSLIGGPEVTLGCMGGTLLENEKGVIYQLQERFDDDEIREMGARPLDSPPSQAYYSSKNYFPAGGLPEDGVLVVRRKNLEVLLSAEDIDEKPVAQPNDVDDVIAMEVMGLLVETYSKERGPNYRHGDKPNVSRIAEDMRNSMSEDVTKMGKRKLQEVLGRALKVWEAKKRA